MVVRLLLGWTGLFVLVVTRQLLGYSRGLLGYCWGGW